MTTQLSIMLLKDSIELPRYENVIPFNILADRVINLNASKSEIIKDLKRFDMIFDIVDESMYSFEINEKRELVVINTSTNNDLVFKTLILFIDDIAMFHLHRTKLVTIDAMCSESYVFRKLSTIY